MLEVTIVYSALFAIGGTLLGIIVGWFACEKWSEYTVLKNAQIASHPEMYDQNGYVLNEELLSVRFTDPEDLED